ncbi:MAG: rod shape-determining protein RodA [Nitrospinota bacterium]|nr:MAG: rod shape-determining protein RodA [Nitrospinota bacterium]
MLDRRLILNFDWVLFLQTLLLTGWGVVTIYSATHGRVENGLSTLYLRQLLWVIYGLIGLVILLGIDYQRMEKYAYLLYLFAMALLLLTLLLGTTVSGSRRWLSVGIVSFQPSELGKLGLILALAKYFDEHNQRYYRLRDLGFPALLVSIPFLLIFEQPDLGTAFVLLAIFLAMLFVAGLHSRSLWILGGIGGAMLPVMWFFLLRDYQKERVTALFHPNADPLGAGYHSNQSKIAIGSGGLWGKGFLAGTQSGLSFLPEKHTDFIFSVLAEELGFLGAALLLLLYLCLLLKGLHIAYRAKDRFGMFLAVGVVAMIGIAVIANIGMAIGVLPVVGIPLPLMSYGGSSAVSTLLGIGLLLNIRMRRFKRP